MSPILLAREMRARGWRYRRPSRGTMLFRSRPGQRIAFSTRAVGLSKLTPALLAASAGAGAF